MGSFSAVGAGSSSDLLIWGPSGVYTYNIGDQKATLKLAQYELPDAAGLCVVPDGKVLFITEKHNMKDGMMDMDDSKLDKIYIMEAE